MIENKRFIIPEYPDCILDTVENKEYPMSSYYTHIFCICDLLNNLSDENEHLREIMGIMPNDDVDDIVNVLNYQESDKRKFQKENEQLKQFKQNVFSLIDKNLEKDKHYYEMNCEDYLNGRIEVLEDLKKELLDD